MKKISLQKGLILINVLVFAGIAIVLTTSLVTWGATILRNSMQLTNREQALTIAEAGIDYYRWHLAHSPTDYYDGNASTTSPGPYIHDFLDKDGAVIGRYALTVTPPPAGTTIVTITATGTVVADTLIKRVIQTKLAIPSLAKYAVIANDNMYFGAGTVVKGPVQSNKGIHFDGVASNTVNSALSTYIDTDQNSSWYQFGVYTTVSPSELNKDATPPSTIPNRPDVFGAGRVFPVPVVDFNALTSNLASLLAIAQTTTNTSFLSSGGQGYHVVLKANDTFDLYKVVSLKEPTNSDCSTNGQAGWGLWSIKTQTPYGVGNFPFPANGVLFFADNVWVDGTINTARLTIAAATLPYNASTSKSITVNKDLLYTNFDGKDVIALIAQNNFNVGYDSLDTQTIDGAIIAQTGRAGRYYYDDACGASSTRSTLNLYGMIATNQRYGFAWTDNTGYTTRNITYDGNLLYGPPPSFPLASSQYSTISWSVLR